MQILFIIPGDINLPTGGYRYDREIINVWKNSNVDVELVSVEGNFPFPSQEDIQKSIAQLASVPPADIAIVDGLLGGAAPDFLEALSKAMPIAALIHHPLCLENGLDENQAQTLKNSEKQGLEFVSGIVTTSQATSRTTSNLFDFHTDKIHTVLPGVERGNKATGSKDNCINLLCVGSVIERKGHRDLLLALSNVKHQNWQLDCIGSTQFDIPLFQKLNAIVEQGTLNGKITFHGNVSEEFLEEAYLRADIFVLPSYFEGYGMAYAEAIVRGLPVIGTTAGAIPETVPETCGILVNPSDIKSLTHALESLINDKELRNKYRSGAIKAEPNFPTWQSSGKQFADILRGIL